MKRVKILLPLLLTSCASRLDNDLACPYQLNGEAKPKMALICLGDDTGWREGLEKALQQQGIYLIEEYTSLSKKEFEEIQLNPFVENVDWLKEMRGEAEFLALVEDEQRVHLLDMRGHLPQTVLRRVCEKAELAESMAAWAKVSR